MTLDAGDDEPLRPVRYWAEPVTDSSRYFVLRISDDKSGREAHVGVGFRDRDDATSFRMGVQEYERDVRRDRTLRDMKTKRRDDDVDEGRRGEDDDDAAPSELSLKDGEKIHVNLKTSTNRKNSNSSARKGSGSLGKGGLLLKKPPSSLDTVVPDGSCEEKKASNSVLPSDGDAAVDDDDDEWGDFQ